MPTPVNAESPFGAEELFYSTTDLRGLITAGNQVFVRVSQYAPSELFGRPHAVVRHPDMPRAVFSLLWKTIQSGRPIAAFVKNMAADGRYYWVLATVFPIDGGYLSVRVKPTSAQIAAIVPVYDAAREAECAGIEAGLRVLHDAVTALGFPTYDDFATAALHDALAARRATLPPRVSRGEPFADAVSACNSRLHGALTRVQQLHAARVDLIREVDTVTGSTEALRMLVLNMRVNATRSADGVTLDQVARGLSGFSEDILANADAFTRIANDTEQALRTSRFLVLAASLQLEMNLFFTDECTRDGRALAGVCDELERLTDLPIRYLSDIHQTIAALSQASGRLADAARRLDETLVGLEVVRVMGRIESARLAEHEARTFHVQLGQLGQVFESNRRAVRAASDIARQLATAAEAVRGDCDAITADLKAARPPATPPAPVEPDPVDEPWNRPVDEDDLVQ